jgi:hypothetical protein
LREDHVFSTKDDEARMSETLEFLGRNTAIRAAAEAKLARYPRAEVSKKISLGFRGFGAKDAAETERRRALRGLLLCLYVSGFPGQVEAAREHYMTKTKGDLLDAIASFFPIAGAGAAKVIEAAGTVKPPLGQLDVKEIYKYRRGAMLDRTVEAGGNCYAGVAQWIYLGGAVSLEWLNQHGGMNPARGDTKPQAGFRWWPPVTTARGAAGIPPGRIVYFSRRAGAGVTVHYALSVRTGVCVGINNPGEVAERWDRTYGNGPLLGGVYSEFRIDGYLATCQALCGGPARERDRYVFVQDAHCIPVNAC